METAPHQPWHLGGAQRTPAATPRPHAKARPPLPSKERQYTWLPCSYRGTSLPPQKSQGPSENSAHLGSQARPQEVPHLGPMAPGQPSRAETTWRSPHSPLHPTPGPAFHSPGSTHPLITRLAAGPDPAWQQSSANLHNCPQSEKEFSLFILKGEPRPGASKKRTETKHQSLHSRCLCGPWVLGSALSRGCPGRAGLQDSWG